jgi:cytochrome c oxidase subunit 1/cytochrome c oxidase subunit I+III
VGTTGFMIEGSMFVLVVIVYFVLRLRAAEWPFSLPPPSLTYGTWMTVVLLISAVPNMMAKHAAERLDLPKARTMMVVCCAFGLAVTAIRVFEFTGLNCRWDSNAYGSIVWVIMGLHTTHVVTDVVDTIVLTALIFTAHANPRRLVDVSENALYWNFIILTWLPI